MTDSETLRIRTLDDKCDYALGLLGVVDTISEKLLKATLKTVSDSADSTSSSGGAADRRDTRVWDDQI